MAQVVSERIQAAEEEVDKVTIEAAPLQVEGMEELRAEMVQVRQSTLEQLRCLLSGNDETVHPRGLAFQGSREPWTRCGWWPKPSSTSRRRRR